MTRFFYSVFFGFVLLGISCIVAAFFLTPEIQQSHFSKTVENLKIESTEVPHVPIEKKIESATNNPIYFVKICHGEIEPLHSQTPLGESNIDLPVIDKVSIESDEDSKKMDALAKKRTYLFISSDYGIPEIITAKIIESENNSELSSVSVIDTNYAETSKMERRAEHGTFNQLRDQDMRLGKQSYDELWRDAKSICFAHSSLTDQEQDEQIDDIRLRSTAYVKLDWSANDTHSKIQIFYQVNGFIHQQEASLNDRSI